MAKSDSEKRNKSERRLTRKCLSEWWWRDNDSNGIQVPVRKTDSTEHPTHPPTPAASLVLHAQHTPQHNTPPHAKNTHHQQHSRGHVTSTPHRKQHTHTLPLLLENKLPPLIVIVVLSTTTVLTALPLVLPHGAPVRWQHRADGRRRRAWKRPSSSAHTCCGGAEHVGGGRRCTLARMKPLREGWVE